MAKQSTSMKGQFRRLAPIEIGAIVRVGREQRYFKRLIVAERLVTPNLRIYSKRTQMLWKQENAARINHRRFQ